LTSSSHFNATAAEPCRDFERAGADTSSRAKQSEAPAALKSQNVPEETRDPADVALDCKIKGFAEGADWAFDK
jgi:hypothetical protein